MCMQKPSIIYINLITMYQLLYKNQYKGLENKSTEKMYNQTTTWIRGTFSSASKFLSALLQRLDCANILDAIDRFSVQGPRKGDIQLFNPFPLYCFTLMIGKLCLVRRVISKSYKPMLCITAVGTVFLSVYTEKFCQPIRFSFLVKFPKGPEKFYLFD